MMDPNPAKNKKVGIGSDVQTKDKNVDLYIIMDYICWIQLLEILYYMSIGLYKNNNNTVFGLYDIKYLVSVLTCSYMIIKISISVISNVFFDIHVSRIHNNE